MGTDVWLRSAEANIQLTARCRSARPAGVHSPRHPGGGARQLHPEDRPGDPRLHGERGTVRYFGDLNAALDIRGAPHRAGRAGRGDPGHRGHHRNAVRTEGHAGEHVQSADLGDRPGVLLVTGYPANEATRLGRANALETGLSYFSSALSSELERALIQDIGVPIDLIEIRPGDARGRASTLTQLAAGWQLGQQDLPHLQRRLLSREPEPVQLQQPRRQPRVPVQPGVEAPERSVEPTIQTCRQDFGHHYRLPEPRTRSAPTSCWEREF